MSDQNLEDLVKDKYTKVCICKSINRATMKKVIQEGAHTVNAVRYKTGAGSGPCHGRRCTPRIEALLEEMGVQQEA
jgi:NAD(P)H-nitrite reductase large subunit